MKQKVIFYILSLLFGGLFTTGYLYFQKVEIISCDVNASKFSKSEVVLPFSHRSLGHEKLTYTCRLKSKIQQNIRLGIAYDEELQSVYLNGKSLSLKHLRKQYGKPALRDWKTGYPFTLKLNRGENQLIVSGIDKGGRFGLNIAQGLFLSDYVVLFFLGVVPLVYGLYGFLFPLLIALLRNTGRIKSFRGSLPFIIIGLGIVLRIIYVVYVPNNMYQHDMKGHIDAIHYYAEHPFELPQPDKSLQFPQQPLYYYTAAVVYSVSKAMGFNEHDAIYSIRVMSIVFASVWLLIGWRLVRLYSQRPLTVNLFLAFLAFTPSFIYLGGAVNNDVLNALLGMASLYYISLFYLQQKRRWFMLAAMSILLAMLTKISSVLYAIFFVVVLLALYFKNTSQRRRYQKEILLFGLGVLFVFGFALFKAYIPADGEFKFVNSALYGGQVIPKFGLEYFLAFHLGALLEAAQSHVMGSNAIRFSLPTYFYGTLFLGEFDFSKHFGGGTLFRVWSQLVFLAGLLYLVGVAGYIYFFKRMKYLQRLIAIPVAINLLLIIKFLLSYWVVCNSDFRYFTPTFGAIGLMIVLGLEYGWIKWSWLKKPIILTGTMLAIVEIIWMATLITAT